MSDAAAPAAAGHDDHPHVNYIAKFYWLVGLTTVEVGVAMWIEGLPKLLLLAFLSFWKAAIVLRYFMHLKTEGTALKLVCLFPVILILILFSLFLLDGWVLGYAAS